MTKKYREGFKYFVERKNGKTDWIDLSSLPKNKGGKRISWKHVDNNCIPFSYGSVSGLMKITYSEQRKGTSYLLCEFEGKTLVKASNDIQRCRFGNLLEAIIYDHIYDVGDKVNNSIILEQLRLKNTNNVMYRAYKLKCLTTNKFYISSESNLRKSKLSPYETNHYFHEKNSLYSVKELRKYIVDIDYAKTINKGSRKSVLCRCDRCGFERNVEAYHLNYYGFKCNKCSSTISYPERMMCALLEINNIRYQTQKRFNALGEKRFDFYLIDYNTVIETHGEQHYRPIGFFDFDKITESDKVKKEYCINNKIKYVAIDCSKSDMDFILSNINLEFIKNKNKDKLEDILIKSESEFSKSMIEEYKSGVTIKKLALKYHSTPDRIRGLLKRTNNYKPQHA